MLSVVDSSSRVTAGFDTREQAQELQSILYPVSQIDKMKIWANSKRESRATSSLQRGISSPVRAWVETESWVRVVVELPDLAF